MYLYLSKNSKSINGTNDFDKEAFENGCQELEKGALIHFNIDCIGNTRANMVQEEYEANLRAKYGDLLEVIIWQSGYAINRHFKLKGLIK